MKEYLFSYGTLQLPRVQLATFGRQLNGEADALQGFKQDWVEITDADVLARSAQSKHPIVHRTDNPEDFVTGMVFEISPEELDLSDAYETSDYARVSVTLASGRTAWLYENAGDEQGETQAG